MRRETDFVLEQAAWPAMLLDEKGRICRVNQAARRVFELPASLSAATSRSSSGEPEGWGIEVQSRGGERQGGWVRVSRRLARDYRGSGRCRSKLTRDRGSQSPAVA